MKKLSLYLLLPLAALCFLSSCSKGGEEVETVDAETPKTVNVGAEDLTGDGYFDGQLYYKITDESNKRFSIYKADKSVTRVTTPDILDIAEKGKYVCTSIANNAFDKCKDLKEIIISDVYPYDISSIGEAAFRDCSGLTKINLPKGITTIKARTFSGCSGLKEINIPNNIEIIGAYAFSDCTGLTSFEIPRSVRALGEGLFAGCTGLTSFNYPDGFENIAPYAFKGCSGLNTINIPNSIYKIWAGAFEGCSGLTSIILPSGVTSIETSAFKGCTGLTEIHCQSENPPSLENNSFDSDSYSKAILYIPKETLKAYRGSIWAIFQKIVEE